MSDNYCDAGGWVVGGEHEIPAAPFDFSWGVRGPVIGCNNLRCMSCDEPVRSVAGYTWTKDTLQRRDDIYREMASPDSDGFEALVSGGAIGEESGARLYVCGCNLHVEQEHRALAEQDDWDYDEGPKWRCAGHPQLALPAAIDGVDVANDSDAEAIVSAHLLGPAPAGAPAFAADYPGAWVHRLLHVLAHEPVARSLGEAVAARLSNTDASLRAAAADVFRRDPMVWGAAAVVDALRDRPELYSGIAIPNGDGTLDEWLQVAVAQRAANGDRGALATLQDVAEHGGKPTQTTLRTLASEASSWLAAHARDILRAHPDRDTARRLLYVMAPIFGDELVETAIEMGEADVIDRAVFLDLVRQLVRDDRGERIRDGLS